jgi:hypothetical protein
VCKAFTIISEGQWHNEFSVTTSSPDDRAVNKIRVIESFRLDDTSRVQLEVLTSKLICERGTRR